MSDPRGKSGDPKPNVWLPPVEKQGHLDTGSVTIEPPAVDKHEEFLEQVHDELNPMMFWAYVATIEELGYEPIFPVDCDAAYQVAAMEYDEALGELKALARA